MRHPIFPITFLITYLPKLIFDNKPYVRGTVQLTQWIVIKYVMCQENRPRDTNNKDFCKDAVIIGGAVAAVVCVASAVSSALTAPLVIIAAV